MKVNGYGAGIDSLRLNGNLLTANLAGAVVGEPTIRRTIEGASTLTVTVSDPEGKLRRRAFVDEATRLIADDLRFTLVSISKSGDDLTLTAEDEVIYKLRQKRGPKKAFRDKVTRAEFVKGLVREAAGREIRFFSPELSIVQPVEGTKTERRNSRQNPDAPGISRDARGLTVKGAPATVYQKQVADKVIRLAMKYRPPRRALVALLITATQESVMGTRGMTSPVDLDSIGLLQGRLQYNRREDLVDFDYNIRRFFFRPWTGYPDGAIAQAKQGREAGVIAQSIQGSAYPERYAPWIPEAQKWIDAYFGGEAGDFEGGSRTVVERYAFEVKKNEDYWTAIKRLADEVNWRAFVVGETFYFTAEPSLLQGKRQMNVRDDTPGIDQVDWQIDAGKRADTATINGRIRNWSAPPGTVAILDESHGPARGRWIVSEIEGRLTNEDVTITLKRPSKPKPEPAPETRETSDPSGGSRSGGSTSSSLEQVQFRSFAPGTPHWGGSATIFEQLIKPYVARKYGFQITSEKRVQEGSDHGTSSVNAYAVDYGTAENYAFGKDIARLLGVPYAGRQDDYKKYPFTAGGKRFRVQIICQTHGTGPHAHIGISRL